MLIQTSESLSYKMQSRLWGAQPLVSARPAPRLQVSTSKLYAPKAVATEK